MLAWYVRTLEQSPQDEDRQEATVTATSDQINGGHEVKVSPHQPHGCDYKDVGWLREDLLLLSCPFAAACFLLMRVSSQAPAGRRHAVLRAWTAHAAAAAESTLAAGCCIGEPFWSCWRRPSLLSNELLWGGCGLRGGGVP